MYGVIVSHTADCRDYSTVCVNGYRSGADQRQCSIAWFSTFSAATAAVLLLLSEPALSATTTGTTATCDAGTEAAVHHYSYLPLVIIITLATN
jgi:hypothetical protein